MFLPVGYSFAAGTVIQSCVVVSCMRLRRQLFYGRSLVIEWALSGNVDSLDRTTNERVVATKCHCHKQRFLSTYQCVMSTCLSINLKIFLENSAICVEQTPTV